jgi:para-aminobenzoate synthetase component 1
MSDKKEEAEHYTITDLLRNDLSIIAENVEVTRFRYIEKINTSHKNLLQTSTEIQGNCKNDWTNNIGHILDQILPAGSITGAPKLKTIEIISEAETHDRGYYTGVACLFDGKNLDSFVMIRMITERNGKQYYKSGGGITHNSDIQKEYKELIEKIYVPIS